MSQIAIDFAPRVPDVTEGTSAAFRRTDTSRAAAEHVNRSLGERQRGVLAVIRTLAGATIHEIAESLHIPDHSASARVRELQLRSLIRDSGKRRKNPSGVKAIIWVVA